MESVDGDIKLSVGLDTGDVKKDAKQLQAEIEKIFASGDTDSPKFERMKLQMKKIYDESLKLQEKLESIANAQIPTEEYEEITAQIKASNKEFETLLEKQDAMIEKGKTYGPVWEELQAKIEEVGNTIRYAEGEAHELENSGKAFIAGIDTQEYADLELKLEYLNDRVRILIGTWNDANQSVNDVDDSVDDVTDSTGELVETTSRYRRIMDSLKAGINKIGAIVKSKLINAFKSAGKQIDKSAVSLRKFVLAGLGIQGIATLARKVFSAVQDGLKTMAGESDQVNKDMSMIVNSFTDLKNSVTAAFQPILAVVAPIIASIISMLNEAIYKIGQFFAALTGQGYVYKAVKAQKSYAGSLKDTAKNADEAKGSLAGFDKLENQTSQKQADSGAGAEDLMPSFELGEIESKISDFAQKVKDAWATGDFFDIGTDIRDAIFNILDSIPWQEIQAVSTKLGKSFATLLNGILAPTAEGITLGAKLGTTLGEVFNTIVDFIDTFATEFDALTAGKNIGDFINNFFSTVDWGQVGHGISELIKGALDLFIGFIETLDTQTLVDSIVALLEGIDWFGILGRLVLLLAEATEMALLELPMLLAAGVFDLIADLFSALGMDSVAGFFKGMADNLRTSVEKLKEWFNEWVVTPIKEFFGIHSPSTLFAEIGTYIVEGLVEGIKTLPEKLKEKYEELKSKLTEFVTYVKTTFQEKISSAFELVKSKVQGIFDSLWSGLKNILNNIIGGVEFLVNKVVSAINTMIAGINSVSGRVGIPAIPMMNTVTLPRLAEGAVIPPNKEFMAILGDQTSGTNIEAPLDTIKQAVREEVGGVTNEEELELLREQNSLLRALLEKDWGPSDDQMFKSVRNSARTFQKSNNKPAFQF